MWGVIRHIVCNPVFDRIKLKIGPTEEGTTYLNYEKVGRICLFCGIMFHTVNNCYLRNSIVTDRIKSQQDPTLVPFQRYGEWIISEDKIPSGVRDSVSQQNTALSTLHNKELTMFNNVFASTDRGKQLEEMSPIEILVQMEKNRDEKSKNRGNCSSGRKERQLHVHDDTVEATATRSDGALHVLLDIQGIHVSQRDGCEPVCQKSTVRGTVSSELERLRRPELVTAQDSGQPMELEINAATELPNSEKDTDMLPYTVEEESMFLQQTIHRATLEKKDRKWISFWGPAMNWATLQLWNPILEASTNSCLPSQLNLCLLGGAPLLLTRTT